MISIKELKEKLDRFRASTGLLFEINVDKDGNVVLDTFLKVEDVSNITDESILISQ